MESSDKLSLINPLRGPCPPDGYRYVFPSDGYIAHAWTYVDWVDVANKHARANGLPDPDPGSMQEQLCLTLPPGWCNYDDPNRERPVMQLEWKDVLRSAETFKNWIAEGVQTVERKEAERRANICARCYFNVGMSGCSVCQATVNKLAGLLPGTSADTMLRSCAVCHCALRMKVWLPQKVLDKEGDSLQGMYPSHCWLKKSGQNYYHESTRVS